VPIHRLPSRAPKRSLKPLGKDCPLGATQGINLTPSKRINPFVVPTQIYPSVVCVIAAVGLTTPSCIRHTVCAYWEMSLLGSIARTEPAERNRRKQNGRNREAINLHALTAKSPLCFWSVLMADPSYPSLNSPYETAETRGPSTHPRKRGRKKPAMLCARSQSTRLNGFRIHENLQSSTCIFLQVQEQGQICSICRRIDCNRRVRSVVRLLLVWLFRSFVASLLRG